MTPTTGSTWTEACGRCVDKLDSTRPATADELFKLVGMTLVSSVGGASGPLYGTFFLRLGAASGTDHRACRPTTWPRRSGPGSTDWRPAASPSSATRRCTTPSIPPSMRSTQPSLGGAGTDAAFDAAAAACRAGRDATIPMVARKGRASYLGERSAGHQDPGATSAALLLDAAAATLTS